MLTKDVVSFEQPGPGWVCFWKGKSVLKAENYTKPDVDIVGHSREEKNSLLIAES